MRAFQLCLLTLTAATSIQQAAENDVQLISLELPDVVEEKGAPEPERESVVLAKETPDHFRREDPQYQTKFANFYPTAAVDFFMTKDRLIGHDNTAQPLENVVIAPP